MKAVKFTFQTADGKYPMSRPRQVDWTPDRHEAVETGQSVGATTLVEMDSKGNILAKLPMPNNRLSS